MVTTSVLQIPAEVRRWTPSAQAAYLERLETRARVKPRAWYCTRGRDCGGDPHPGANYKHARPLQWMPPGQWFCWLNMSGRGAGKTRAGAECVRWATKHTGRIALVGPTGPDARDVMVEGDSGILEVCLRAGLAVEWEPSKKKLTFGNGAVAHVFSAEEPDRLRGPQHGWAWADEPAHWANADDVWSNLEMGLRLGSDPRVVATTTPLPTPWLRKLAEDERTVVTRESTYANLDNLAPPFARKVLARYEGSRLGRQELHGEILEDIEGALWQPGMIEEIEPERVPADLDEIVVGVDPAGTSTRRSDETGIVVVGRDGDTLYVLADYSGKYSPGGWARKVATVYEHHRATKVVAEKNYGGDMVRDTLHNANSFMPVVEVNSRHGKLPRAEPVVALYEQRRVFHAAGMTELADQMISWVPGKGSSPDRVDALVHAVHALVRTERPAQIARPSGRMARRTTTPTAKVPRALRLIGGTR